jgi:hypothetical protein
MTTTQQRKQASAELHARLRAEYPEEAAKEDAGRLFSYALAAADRRMAERKTK